MSVSFFLRDIKGRLSGEISASFFLRDFNGILSGKISTSFFLSVFRGMFSDEISAFLFFSDFKILLSNEICTFFFLRGIFLDETSPSFVFMERSLRFLFGGLLSFIACPPFSPSLAFFDDAFSFFLAAWVVLPSVLGVTFLRLAGGITVGKIRVKGTQRITNLVAVVQGHLNCPM